MNLSIANGIKNYQTDSSAYNTKLKYTDPSLEQYTSSFHGFNKITANFPTNKHLPYPTTNFLQLLQQPEPQTLRKVEKKLQVNAGPIHVENKAIISSVDSLSAYKEIPDTTTSSANAANQSRSNNTSLNESTLNLSDNTISLPYEQFSDQENGYQHKWPSNKTSLDIKKATVPKEVADQFKNFCLEHKVQFTIGQYKLTGEVSKESIHPDLKAYKDFSSVKDDSSSKYMTICFSGNRQALRGLEAGKYMISFGHVLNAGKTKENTSEKDTADDIFNIFALKNPDEILHSLE